MRLPKSADLPARNVSTGARLVVDDDHAVEGAAELFGDPSARLLRLPGRSRVEPRMIDRSKWSIPAGLMTKALQPLWLGAHEARRRWWSA
jgi:hypothetical protein